MFSSFEGVRPCIPNYVRSVFEGARGVLAKVGLDQGLFAPSFIVVFVSIISALNGHSLQVAVLV
jgi:hypothetical protein